MQLSGAAVYDLYDSRHPRVKPDDKGVKRKIGVRSNGKPRKRARLDCGKSEFETHQPRQTPSYVVAGD
jgi:hypothetical protein